MIDQSLYESTDKEGRAPEGSPPAPWGCHRESGLQIRASGRQARVMPPPHGFFDEIFSTKIQI